MDRSFLYGDALFETVRVEGGRARRLSRHIGRFERSAHELGYPESAIREGLDALAQLGRAEDGLWRVTVTRPGLDAPFGGTGGVVTHRRDLSPPSRPRLVSLAGWYLPGDPLAAHKTTSYLRWVEARRRAIEQGFDDALMLSADDRVGETSTCNAFVVVGDDLYTAAHGVLPGTVREAVLDNASELGLAVHLGPVSLDILDSANEIVLTSAGVGAVSAESLDDRRLVERVGPVLRQGLEEWA